jgi:DNA polymerase-3 subunit alpha
LIDKFAGYGFNKSHSAAYGLITYQTGVPQAPPPGVVHGGADDLRQVEQRQRRQVHRRGAGDGPDGAVARHQRVGPRLLGGPSQEESGDDFEEQIRFGLAGRARGRRERGRRDPAARKSGGNFKSLFELCRRVDLKKVNKRTLEGLTCAGAFDLVSAAATGR